MLVVNPITPHLEAAYTGRPFTALKPVKTYLANTHKGAPDAALSADHQKHHQ